MKSKIDLRAAIFFALVTGIAACAPHDNLPHVQPDDVPTDVDIADDVDVPDAGDRDLDDGVVHFDTGVPGDALDDATDSDVVPPLNCDGPLKPFYCPCESNAQCQTGFCITVDDPDVARRCSRVCVDECEFDWECRSLGGGDPVFLCQPPLQTLCRACTQNSNCETIGSLCVTFPDGRFCGKDCSIDANSCPADNVCQAITNDLGQTIGNQCVPASGSCQCPVGTDYTSDPANCGFCTNACSFFGAESLCTTGTCALGKCLPDFMNLNGVAEDGCEYACTAVEGEDWPDAVCNGSDCDQDCDGIDGSWNRGVFVNVAAGPRGDGTPETPLRTITAGIAAAVTLGRDHVYIASGNYVEEVTLVDGVSIFGGYSNDGLWRRDITRNRTHLSNGAGLGSIRVVIADGIDSHRTVVDGLDVTAGNNGNTGGSSYGIWIRNSSEVLEIVRVTAVGGNGGGGASGADGSPGSDGVIGQPGSSTDSVSTGISGSCNNCNCTNFNTNGGKGGASGTNQCSGSPDAAGGRGGNSGCGEGGGDPKPQAGSASSGGASGGVAPSAKSNGNGGQPGGDGGRGSHGDGGTAGGTVSTQGFWTGNSGGTGGRGNNGVGGGGGSGGGGHDNGFWSCASWGGGGGGGGSGGCGGTSGTRGTAGGGSFGVFIHNASPTLRDCDFGHRNGGNGDRGGTGSGGGLGKSGGGGGGKCDGAGVGGGGGRGGAGGRGGNGGGGGGGVAYGVYLSGTSDPVCVNLRFDATSGTGGLGGAGGDNISGVPAGSKGADGTYADKSGTSGRCR